MAEIQEFDNEVGEIEAVEDTQVKQQDAQTKVKQEEDDLPEEFKGKTLKELAKIAQDRQVMIGRQAQEVGEVRRLADELLKSQLSKKPEEKPQEVDIFENPQEAIRQAIANNPDVINAKQMAEQMKQQVAVSELAKKHPDFGQVAQDGEFVEWVKSSKQRTKMFNEAQNYDVDAADELLSNFKIQKSVKQQQVAKVVSEAEKVARDKSLSAASVDSGGSGESSQKVWRRADLIRLKISDPLRYEAMNDEILKAYSDGRVR